MAVSDLSALWYLHQPVTHSRPTRTHANVLHPSPLTVLCPVLCLQCRQFLLVRFDQIVMLLLQGLQVLDAPLDLDRKALDEAAAAADQLVKAGLSGREVTL